MGLLTSLPLRPIPGHSYWTVVNNINHWEKEFAARYEAAYIWFLIQKIRRETENVEEEWQLRQRKWDSYGRPLHKGMLYVLSKSDRKCWKRRFCVLLSNYMLNVYKTEEEYAAGAKPHWTHTFSGYILAEDVDVYLRQKLEIAARDLGYINHDIAAFGKKVTMIGVAGERPTQHLFCVDHPWRGITYFATDSLEEKDRWSGLFKDGIRHLEGCLCTEEVAKAAFAFAVEQSLRAERACLDQIMLSGTQQEILTYLLCIFQSRECKEIVLPRITGGIVKKHRAWKFVLTSIHNLIKGIVTKKYLGWREECEKSCNAKRQEIVDNLAKISAAFEVTQKVIKESLAECFDPILISEIIPKLPDVIRTMSDSLTFPLRSTRELCKSLVSGVSKEVSLSQKFANNIDKYFLNQLDYAPRNPQFTCPIGNPSSGTQSAIATLQSIFPRTDFEAHMNYVYLHQQQLLDSAVYTFESLCGDSITANDGKLTPETIAKAQDQVLKDLDHDVILAQKNFFRSVLLSATMERARKSIEEYCNPKMAEFQSTIPEELREYMPICNVFTDVLTKHFTERVNPEMSRSFRSLRLLAKELWKFKNPKEINKCMKELSNDGMFPSSPSFGTSPSSPVDCTAGYKYPLLRTNSMGEPIYPEGDEQTLTPTRVQPCPELRKTDCLTEDNKPCSSSSVVNTKKQGYYDPESGMYYSDDDMDGETGEVAPPLKEVEVEKREVEEDFSNQENPTDVATMLTPDNLAQEGCQSKDQNDTESLHNDVSCNGISDKDEDVEELGHNSPRNVSLRPSEDSMLHSENLALDETGEHNPTMLRSNLQANGHLTHENDVGVSTSGINCKSILSEFSEAKVNGELMVNGRP